MSDNTEGKLTSGIDMIAAVIERLESHKGHKCLFCLVVNSLGLAGRFSFLMIYESPESRERGLKYYQREYKLSDTVFFVFEIPIDFYLEKAVKLI